jgi:hypothetical protein
MLASAISRATGCTASTSAGPALRIGNDAPHDLRAQIRICEASRKQRLGDLLAPVPVRQQPARNGDIAGVERSDLHPNHRTGRPGSPCSASRMNCSTDRAGELGGPFRRFAVGQPWLESSVQCTSGRDQNRSERLSGDRPARLRPGQRLSATRPPPESAWPCLHRSVSPPAPRALGAGRPHHRVRARAQHVDRWSACERHDFPCPEFRGGSITAGLGAAGSSVHVAPHQYRQPDTSAGDVDTERRCRRAAIRDAAATASRLDPGVIR